MNIFDGLQESVYNIVAKTMGYIATWTPLNGTTQTATVLYNDATKTAKILDQEYSPKNCMIEYKQGDFIGLKEAADAGNEETIIVNGISYGVLEVNSKFDGKTFLANLTII